MPWIRIDSARMQHPRMRRAGPWGAVVVEAAWEIARTFHPREGTLSADQWHPEYLAYWTMFDREEHGAEWMRQGMEAAERAGLVVRDASLSSRVTFSIRDWRDFQWDETHAERQKRYREKQRETAPVAESDASRDAVTLPDQTRPIKKERSNTPRKRSASLPSEHWAWGLVDAYHAEHGSEPVNRAAEAAALDALQRIDGHSAETIAEVLLYVARDVVDPPRGTWAGWAGVVRSLVSLRQRKTKGDATKFEKALAQYRDAQKPRAEQRTRFPSSPVKTERCTDCGALLLYPDEGCDHCKAAAAAGGNGWLA